MFYTMKPIAEIWNSMLVNTFFFTVKIVNRAKYLYANIYNNSETFRNFVILSKYIYCCITLKYVEPTTPIWMSKSVLLLNKPYLSNMYNSLYENYSLFINVDTISSKFDELYLQFFFKLFEFKNRYCIYNIQETYKGSELFIMKLFNDDNEKCYFVSSNEKQILNMHYNQRSCAKFLSIEYIHPDMKNSIELTLDNSWFIAGNELFMPTFVLRELKYQSQPFIFDARYTIAIMDSDINMIEFGNNKHIELTKNGYKVVDHEFPNMNDQYCCNDDDSESYEEKNNEYSNDYMLLRDDTNMFLFSKIE